MNDGSNASRDSVFLSAYRGDNGKYIIGLEGLGHVDLRSCAHEAGKDGDDEEHQGQDLDKWGLVGVCDDPLRGIHVGRRGGGQGYLDMMRGWTIGQIFGDFDDEQ